MRLTQLKLVGFKSFVDPTVIAFPGQRVGVVGPNGCGKSNIMDAVRWVLGESKASELRGESMQDVIFNGSVTRKPVARALVELVFDNTLGRAQGQWSAYTEIAVKRVLMRNGTSDYFINHLKVRRKDITDLFLGTGLGPRAYAIIGQGMISRVIEARPDELRVFLEEAAGVSRYKERRYETANRLVDTHENLARVDDIRAELQSQISKLESQAEVALRYQSLQSDLTEKQHLLWLVKKSEAMVEKSRLQQAMAALETRLELEIAAIRDIENQQESARESHFAESEKLHQAQSALYEKNADVARLEAERRHRQDSRRLLQVRLENLQQEEKKWRQSAEKQASDRQHWLTVEEKAGEEAKRAEATLHERMAISPQVEESLRQSEEELHRLKSRQTHAAQKLEIALTHKAHAERGLQSIAAKRLRLKEEVAAKTAPDADIIVKKEAALEKLQGDLAADQAALNGYLAALPEKEKRLLSSTKALQQEEQARVAQNARRHALQQLQEKTKGSSLSAWLLAEGIDQSMPFWRDIHVESGWENAIESILREKLNALPRAENLDLHTLSRPPEKLCFWDKNVRDPADTPPLSADALILKVLVPPLLSALLADCLHGVRAAPSLEDALKRREELGAGESFVTAEGDVVSQTTTTFFAQSGEAHGVLERQREIDALSENATLIEERLAKLKEEHALIEEDLDDLRAQIVDTREYLSDAQQKCHQLLIELAALRQAAAHYHEIKARFSTEEALLNKEEESETAALTKAISEMNEIKEGLDRTRHLVAAAESRFDTATQIVKTERGKNADLDRALQEARLSLREAKMRFDHLIAQENTATQELLRIAKEVEALEAELLKTHADESELLLQSALANRQEKENLLVAARVALESAALHLKTLDEQRLTLNMGIDPLRQSISETQQKIQSIEIQAAQMRALLEDARADETALRDAHPHFEKIKTSGLQTELNRLQAAVESLGAVNLAALDALKNSRERDTYLEHQAADLREAMATLENAIRQIDRETRHLLQSTFDTVNRHFGELFPILFGGGRAALLMTGEEILDAGVQVMAEPPGKKNSSIHLLSGGEKALTAIALVFAIFQLNPAPFCLLDEVDAPLDDSNTERFCQMVTKMSAQTQFLFISHNKIAMEMAEQLVGITMQESGVSRVVSVDIEEAMKMGERQA